MNLDQLQKICQEATPGPWKYDWGNWCVESGIHRDDICLLTNLTDREGMYKVGDPMDGEFIAAAREYMPKLLSLFELALQAFRYTTTPAENALAANAFFDLLGDLELGSEKK